MCSVIQAAPPVSPKQMVHGWKNKGQCSYLGPLRKDDLLGHLWRSYLLSSLYLIPDYRIFIIRFRSFFATQNQIFMTFFFKFQSLLRTHPFFWPHRTNICLVSWWSTPARPESTTNSSASDSPGDTFRGSLLTFENEKMALRQRHNSALKPPGWWNWLCLDPSYSYTITQPTVRLGTFVAKAPVTCFQYVTLIFPQASTKLNKPSGHPPTSPAELFIASKGSASPFGLPGGGRRNRTAGPSLLPADGSSSPRKIAVFLEKKDLRSQKYGGQKVFNKGSFHKQHDLPINQFRLGLKNHHQKKTFDPLQVDFCWKRGDVDGQIHDILWDLRSNGQKRRASPWNRSNITTDLKWQFVHLWSDWIPSVPRLSRCISPKLGLGSYDPLTVFSVLQEIVNLIYATSAGKMLTITHTLESDVNPLLTSWSEKQQIPSYKR